MEFYGFSVFNKKMSGTGDEGKESHKALPLDLARNQITAVRTVDGKAPLVMTSHALRGMRVLAPGTSATPAPNQTIITTNIVPHTVFKQGKKELRIFLFYVSFL